MKKRLIHILALLAIISMACGLPVRISWTGSEPQGSRPSNPAEIFEPEEEQSSEEGDPIAARGNDEQGGEELEYSGSPALSDILFCEDVTDDGEPIHITETFPAGTTTVWAYFEYENMTDGMPWSRLWEQDGEVFVESGEEEWVDGEAGWVAYSIGNDDPQEPLSGSFRLTLFVDGEAVQEGEFYVEPVEVSGYETWGDPAFGAIHFAYDVTPELAPDGETLVFEPGVTEVYAVFSYMNMSPGQPWQREWLLDGELYAESGELGWEEEQAGFDYCSLSAEEGLDPGVYTLNLYMDGQIARSAQFEVLGETVDLSEPANPEDVVDSYMMPAWEMLANAGPQILNDLAQFVLDNHVPVYVDASYDGLAAYRHTCEEPPVVGEVIVSYTYWNDHPWEEVAAALTHELTHAVQHMSGNYPCECSIEKEYYAYVAEFYALQELGRPELLDQFAGAWNEDGEFDGDLLWDAIKESYPDCQEY